MVGLLQVKREMVEALIVLIDQKIGHYSRQDCDCGCDGEGHEDDKRYLAELRAGRRALSELAADDERLAVSRNGAVGEGSLVRLANLGESPASLRFFIVPFGAGSNLKIDDESCLTVTADSQLGEAILGRKPGEEVDLDLGDRRRALRIEQVD